MSDDLEALWQRINDAFDADASLDADAYLRREGRPDHCPDQPLSEDADALLQHTFATGQLPESLRLSKYRIIDSLNTGGQSEIYLAERADGVYRKTVVIKFISQRVSYASLKQQFMQEMQLLADLNHPGIVSIHDGGLTDDDQPWLLLEYIDGAHIDEHCETHRLDAPARVRLIMDLCDALSFVHQRGVTHQDIKAANVLVREVNQVATPVLIDFGIASARRHEDSGHKELFGTPGFSAPEQMRGEHTDDRADVFSTGMLLAQLLVAGRSDNIGLLERKAREALLREAKVDREMIQIIDKATAKTPARRYPNADMLRTDLYNWLNGLPLIANQNRALHVLGKSLRRHKLATALGGLVLLGALGAGIKYTRDITELQAITVQEKNASDALFNFMLTELFDQLSRIGRIDLLQLVAERSIEHLQGRDLRTLDERSRLQSAIAFSNAGKVFDALALTDRAIHAFDEGLDQLETLRDVPEYRHVYLHHLALLKTLKGRTLTAEGQQLRTEQTLLEALQSATDAQRLDPNEDNRFLQWEAHTQLGWHHLEYAEADKALSHIRQAIDTAAAVLKDTENTMKWTRNLSHSWQVMGWYEYDFGDPAQAVVALNKALELAETTVDSGEADIDYLNNRRILLNQLAYIHIEANRGDLASDAAKQAIEAGRALQLRAPENREYQRELAYSFTMAGELEELNQRHPNALAHYRNAREISARLVQADDGDYSAINDLASDIGHVASALENMGHVAEAQNEWQTVDRLLTPVVAQEPNNIYYQMTLLLALLKLDQVERARPMVAALRNNANLDERLQQIIAAKGL